MEDPTKRHITKIAREAETLVIHTMRDRGVGSGEFDLIHYIRHNPGSSQKEIAAGLNMDKGAVARRTARLERKGYLYRTDNPADGRSKLLFATEKAEDLKLSKASVEATFYGWLVQELPEAERDAFLGTLETLYWRSKRESRAGFPHVNALLGEHAVAVDEEGESGNGDAPAAGAELPIKSVIRTHGHAARPDSAGTRGRVE